MAVNRVVEVKPR